MVMTYRNDCLLDFLDGTGSKESTCQCMDIKDISLIPGLGRSPGEGNGYPFQYYGLENSRDRIVLGSQRVRHD